jgi:hypothetical protein
MKRSHIGPLSRLDNAVRWIPGDMSDKPSVDRKHQPLRWVPLLVIALSCFLLVACLIWPVVLDRVSLGTVISIMTGMVLSIPCGVLIIYMNGPLGKPSREDDEREAAVRKDSFLFCLALLAGLNGLGQPILLIMSHWQNWQSGHSAMVLVCALILNATLLGTLPTLYASWRFQRLPKESL